jgi:hypothetical protein
MLVVFWGLLVTGERLQPLPGYKQQLVSNCWYFDHGSRRTNGLQTVPQRAIYATQCSVAAILSSSCYQLSHSNIALRPTGASDCMMHEASTAVLQCHKCCNRFAWDVISTHFPQRSLPVVAGPRYAFARDRQLGRYYMFFAGDIL